MELSQLETFVDSINKMRGCKTSKCHGNLVPIFVRTVGLGGGIHICFGCNGCRSKQAVFETYSKYKPAERTNCIILSVQVAFIMAGGTHAVYAKTPSHALGMKTFFYKYNSFSTRQGSTQYLLANTECTCKVYEK